MRRHGVLLLLKRWARHEPKSVWVFGGAVRDGLQGRVPGDWDLVCAGAPRAIAHRLARFVNGSAVCLSVQFGLYRIVPPLPLPWFDVQSLNGQTLEAFLASRDYACNAMAWPLQGSTTLIDPMDGWGDLLRGRLRLLPGALQQDPVRALRGLRLAVELGFRFSAQDFDSIGAVRADLHRVAAERVRDEIQHLVRLWPAGRRYALAALNLALGSDVGRGRRLDRLVQNLPPRSRNPARMDLLLAAAVPVEKWSTAGLRWRLGRGVSSVLRQAAGFNHHPPASGVEYLTAVAAKTRQPERVARLLAAGAKEPLRRMAQRWLRAACQLETARPLLDGRVLGRLTGLAGPALGRLRARVLVAQVCQGWQSANQATAWISRRRFKNY